MSGRRLLAITTVATVVLVAACSTEPRPTASRSPAATRPSSRTSATAAASALGRRPALKLLPAPCTQRSVTVVPGESISPATGERPLSFEVRSRRLSPCTLWGSPRVRLRDRHGAVLPFRYLHRGLYADNSRALPVAVRAGHPAVFLVAKYRCDVDRHPRYAASATVSLPYLPGRYRIALHGRAARTIPLCGPGDGPQELGVSPLRSSYRQLPPTQMSSPRSQYAVSMRSSYLPPRGISYGRGDLDGDGRPDVVVVRSSGLVTADVSGAGAHRLRLAPDRTLRLQALSSFGRGAAAYALVATTTIGCCGGYPLGQTGTRVLALVHGRLAPVMAAGRPWEVSFSVGHGDFYAGLVCSADGITQLEVHQVGTRRLLVQRTRYRLSGLRVHRLSTVRTRVPGGPAEALRLSRSSCPGMNARGWASVT